MSTTANLALKDGATGPETSVGPLTRTDIVRYAGASGDFNPIHHDEEFARGAGMPTVFSVGMHSAGVVAQYLARWVGLSNVQRFGARLTGQVWPGDTLTVSGRVVRVQDGLAHIELAATRQTGDVVVKATAIARCR